MKALYAVIILSFLSYRNGQACSCVYIPTFCETITYNGDSVNSNYLIVHASVENKFASGMRIKVIDVLFGHPDQSELTIANGNGADCRMSTIGFTIGDQHIFALFGQAQDGYNLYECGVTTLTVDGNQITGAIAPGIVSLAIEDFPELQGCGNLGSVLTTITVAPTLTSDIIKVATTSELLFIDIAMYDMQGRTVFSRSPHILMEADPLVIPTDRFPSGCYTIVVEANGIRQVIRVVILSSY